MFYKYIYWAFFIAVCLFAHGAVFAQVEDKVYKTDYRLNAGDSKSLFVELDNISFFKDNEFAGEVMEGYSLPGLWLQPKLVYQPLKNIKLELGLHALVYSGAYKYPSMAYDDIAVWKGNQYQKGSHLLPFFRAQFELGRVNLVVGNIYGGSTHRLIAPLYHPELNMTADPEMGFQLLFDTRAYHLDVWVNWQSYIFENDTHQEAFTVGLSSQIDFTPTDARVHVYSPIQATIQHRGGEQDTLFTNSVQTLMNGAIGAGITWNTDCRVLKRFNVEADFVGYYQQAGKLWGYDNGIGFYVAAYADLKDFRVKAGYFYAKDFISLFGIPYFGAASTRNKGALFDKPQTLFASAEYSRTFGKRYALGAQVDVYQSMPGKMIDANGVVSSPGNATSFSFGIFFRINPRFLLKKWE